MNQKIYTNEQNYQQSIKMKMKKGFVETQEINQNMKKKKKQVKKENQ